jgi:hypothetical protein
MATEPEVIEFEENKPKRILIDGDVLIHMACWQKPLTKVKQLELEVQADELEEFGKFTKSSKIRERLEKGVLTYQPIISKAQARFRFFMKTIQEHNYSNIFSMAIGDSKNNWRLDIHPEYKLHKARVGSNDKRAPYIQELRLWAIEEYSAHYCQGYEADDAIRIWANRMNLDEYVVCSVDKDLNLVPGNHYDPKTDDKSKRFWYMEPIDSAMFFWEQMLTGDSIDNIPGIVGIGPKKAAALLADCVTEQDCKEVVLKQYDLKYGEDGYKKLMFNGQLLHIWRTKGDNWYLDPKNYENITGTKPVTGA